MIAVLSSMALLFNGCGNKEVLPEEGTYTRVTIEINPHVEFMVDDQNKVISATALNDDGSILLAGEVLTGMKVDDATEHIIRIADATGYIASGKLIDTGDEIKISVSGTTKFSKGLIKNLVKKADGVIKKLGLQNAVKEVNALAIEELRDEVVHVGYCTKEEAANLNEKELYTYFAASRLETASLATVDLREAYYTAKTSKIAIARRQATANVISSLGFLYSVLAGAYSGALNLYSSAISALDEFRYNTFVSPNSDYQKSIQKLRENKAKYIADRNAVSNADKDSPLYQQLLDKLKVSEEQYESALNWYISVGKTLNDSLQKLIDNMKKTEAALDDIEKSFLTKDEVKEKLEAKASETEKTINEIKKGFFDIFESMHKNDIEIVISSLESVKKVMQEQAQKGLNPQG